MIKSKRKHAAGLVIVWEFRIRPKSRKRFEGIYGPRGVWAKFFHSGQGYLRTELLSDPERPTRYCTLDFWISRAAYERFRKRHASEYRSIDEECEVLTTKETLIGYFETV